MLCIKSVKSLENVAGFEQRMVCSSLVLSNIVGAMRRAGLRNDTRWFRPQPISPKVPRY